MSAPHYPNFQQRQWCIGWGWTTAWQNACFRNLEILDGVPILSYVVA
jgi:hypothetical protein